MAPDAGHGDRRTDRLGAFPHGSQGQGARASTACLPADPASRTTYLPGELAQCDLWFPDVDIPLGSGQSGRGRLPVIVMVSGYSRWITARMIPSRATEDLFAGQWALIQALGAVPKMLVWDGEGDAST